MTTSAAGTSFSASAEGGVLAAVRENVTAARAVEVERAELVVAWVQQRAIDPASLDQASAGAVFDPDQQPGLPEVGLPGTEQPMRLAGAGAPLVSDLGFTRLATALGQSNEAAMAYVGGIVELAYRLPQLWARVRGGAGQPVPGADGGAVDEEAAPGGRGVGGSSGGVDDRVLLDESD